MMMQEAVKILYRNSYHTSALWPFSYSYYRKFGWEVGSEHRSYIVPSELAAELASPDGTRPALEVDLPAISRLVDRFARRYNCVTIRDDLWWSCMRATYRFEFDYNEESRASIWVHETEKAIDGYAIFEVAGEGEEKSVRVKEIVADTPAARNAILSRLASVGAQHIIFPAPIDDGFLQELANPRAVRSELHPGFQFRAINPPAALELRSVDPKLAGCLGFTVSDPVLDGFDFDIEVADGRITKAKCRAEERLSMNIQTFSQAYCGYVSSIRAAELGRVEATSQRAVEFADRLFPKVVPFRSMMELG
jgi:predicted acetyltransferase